MEVYLIKKNNNFENMNNQAINNFKKFGKKRKKFIACNYDWKEFYSDDEENSYSNLTKNEQDKTKRTRKLSHCSNVDRIKKTYTINKIQNRIDLDIKNVDNNIRNRRTSKVSSKTSNKKVHFPTKNLVKYIDVESYKKYNSINTDINSSIDDNEEYFIEQKADVKCTCLLF
jgi:hypothetical protein